MTGSGAKKRQQLDQVLAYRLSQKGLTNREIAERLGKKVEQIPGMVVRGERLAKDGTHEQ